jgi:hypothetical protein
MTDPSSDERILRGLRAIAREQLPERVLIETFDQTRTMTQGPPGRLWWSRASSTVALAIAVGGVAVILVGVGVGSSRPAPVEPLAPLNGTISGVWSTDPGVAATIERSAGDNRNYYWRAVVFDQLKPGGMTSTQTTTVVRPAGSRLLEGTAEDAVRGDGEHPFTFTVLPGQLRGPYILSAGTPDTIDHAVRLATVGQAGYFVGIEQERSDRDEPYTMTALADDGLGAGARQEALRVAGTSYPPEVERLYTAQMPGVVGPHLLALRDGIVRTARSTAPFDVAQRAVDVLRGPGFTYDTDVRDIDCGTMSVVECFATTKRGYCEHFATTMIAVLRNLGIPSRLVEGFLPGERAQGSSVEVIHNWNAHAWVEVYFPGHGWVAFDPTPGT